MGKIIKYTLLHKKAGHDAPLLCLIGSQYFFDLILRGQMERSANSTSSPLIA